jgi:hypothetical protein
MWKFIGGGVTIPLSGASSALPDIQNERHVFNNLGLWLKLAGNKDVGSVKLRFGGALTVNVPSSTEVKWDTFEGQDTRYLPAMGALYADYYHHGTVYPDLQGAFQVAIRPEVDFGLRAGPMTFQVELGFDFILLGSAYNPDSFPPTGMDMDDVYLFHFGLATAVQPIPWLQLAMELTGVVQMAGTSGTSWAYNSEDAADNEIMLTPSVAFLLPVGERGTGHLSLGLRVPLGEVGSSAGPLQLDPILVVATGFRFH